MQLSLHDFIPLIPELGLIFTAILSLMAGLFCPKQSHRITNVVLICLIGLICFLCYSLTLNFNIDPIIFFNQTLFSGGYTNLIKLVILFFTFANITIYRDFCYISSLKLQIEFITLIIFATIGIFFAISAGNFLILFCAIELQALCSYGLTSFNNKSYKSSEAGLKYFVLGALVSCISLFGISLIYGFSGSLEFHSIKETLLPNNNTLVFVGIVLVISSMLFKLSAAPLHHWTPDVYEGAPIAAVGYFSSATKIAIFIVLINLVQLLDYDIIKKTAVYNHSPKEIITTLLRIVSILSMIIGAFGAIRQTSLKRLMAYSAILNVGYGLIGLVIDTKDSYVAGINYLIVYALSSIGIFTLLISALGMKSDDATFDDIKELAAGKKTIAVGLTIIIFSMIGIPPLAGFFAKYYLFYAAVEHNEFLLLAIGLITSVIAAYYYLKVVKTMYIIEEPEKTQVRIPTNNGLLLIGTIIVVFVFFFSTFANQYFNILENNNIYIDRK